MVAGLPKDVERGASKHRRIRFSFESFNRCKKHSVCFGDANDCTSRSALSPSGANNRAASCAGVQGGGEPSAPPPALSHPSRFQSGKGFRAFLVGAGAVRSEEEANMAKRQRPGTMSIHIRQSYGEEASVRVPHWPGGETGPLSQLPRHRGDQQAPQLGGEEGVGGGMR